MMSLPRLLIAPLTVAALLRFASGDASQVVPIGYPQESAAPAATATAEVFASAAAPAPVAEEVLVLRDDLADLLGSLNAREAVHGVLVVSLDRGDTLFSVNPDLPLAPASNMKLFSTAAALYYLGPDFRYSTYALADGEIRDSVLYGDLVLYGTGDPAISSRMLESSNAPLRALADSLLARGIREITGDVVGDGSYFDDAWIATGWKEDYRLDSYSAPIGALSLAENVVSIRVRPGAAAGQPAEIRTVPDTRGLLVQNRVRTVASGGSVVRFSYHPDGLIVEGQIARRHPGVARTVTVVDPANYAAAAFRAVLEQEGIRVHGGVRTIRLAEASPVGPRAATQGDDRGAPPPRVIGTHLSPTLRELVTVTNHVSQNLFAEAFFKTVGRVALGEGSFAAGARAVQYFLECEKPFDFSQMRIYDGSGLSPEDRVTARATIHLLDLMTRTDVWDAFYESLPLAGSPIGGSHSLRGRMRATPAANNLRAKTGTISNVSSLSGYVRAANGELLAFSIYTNGIRSTWLAKRLEDAIGARLASFTREDPGSLMEGVLGADPGPAVSEDAPESVRESTETAAATAPVVAEPPEEPAATRIHRVSRGETLDGIARRYGLPVTDLQRANPGIEPRRLQIGQRLTIPTR